MIKLSDYLNYLNNEVVQARKKADLHAVAVAKEYAQHEYLKYFRVPRFSIPVVKMNVPIKINELDAKVTYNFSRDYDNFIAEVNNKITQVNLDKGYKIKPLVKEEVLDNPDILSIFDNLEKYDYKPVYKMEDNLSKIDLNKITNVFSRNLRFTASNNTTDQQEELVAYKSILTSSLANRFKPVNVNLNNIFIDPDTSKEEDKDKILLTLDVEMVEEGIKIRKVTDSNGNEVEEIIFE